MQAMHQFQHHRAYCRDVFLEDYSVLGSFLYFPHTLKALAENQNLEHQ
jgi:hypothetical protein